MTLVYAYGIVLPVLLWIALRYMGVGEWSVVEAVAVWGYAMFVWIPVSVRIGLLLRYGVDIIDMYDCRYYASYLCQSHVGFLSV